MHPLMSLGNAVTGGDEAEFDGGAPGLANALLDVLRDQIQVVMARNDPVPGVGDSDQGPLQVIIAVAHGFV